jgi:hypothetical protein
MYSTTVFHILYFESRNELRQTFGPTVAKRIFVTLLSQELQGPEAPEVEVTLVPEVGAVEKVLSLPRLRTLYIRVVRPNPDVSDATRRRVLGRLEEAHAQREEITLTKSAGAAALTPTEDMRQTAEVAAENGVVRGEGRDANGVKTELSTSDYRNGFTWVLTVVRRFWRGFCQRSGAEQTVTLASAIRDYWETYGGSRAFFLSPVLWTSAVITAIIHHVWVHGLWADAAITILPNLLGLSIGAMAILLAFPTTRIFKILTEDGRKDSFYLDLASRLTFHNYTGGSANISASGKSICISSASVYGVFGSCLCCFNSRDSRAHAIRRRADL